MPRWESGVQPSWYGPYTRQFVACVDYGFAEFVATDPHHHFAGVNHACRRDRLFALGLYREDLGIRPGRGSIAGNDDELFARAFRNGYRLVYNPRVCVHHLIAPSRSLKATHRRITRLVANNQYEHLRETPPAAPSMLGLPRYYYRKPIEHLAGWFRGLLARDPSRRFYNEIRLLRFATLIGRALQDRCFRRKPNRINEGANRSTQALTAEAIKQ